jgi:HlyD family secretion protein
MRRAGLWLALVVVSVTLVVAAVAVRLRHRASAELLAGGYLEAEQIQVGSKLGGRVAEVFVDEGAEVPAGEKLVVFETDQVEAELSEARAQLDRAQAQLAELEAGTRLEVTDQAAAKVARLREKVAMLRRGPRAQEIEQARLLYERAKTEYANTRVTYERQVALAERNATARETLDTTRTAMEASQRVMGAAEQQYELLRAGSRPEEIAMAEHELEEAQAALDLAKHGPRPEEIAQARASVEAARAHVRQLEVQLDEGTVRAPLDSVVEAFDIQPGDLIAPNLPLATLVRKDQLWVRAFVPETELGLVHDNQAVEVTVDSFPGRRFQGLVLRVNRVAEFTPRNVQTYEERQNMMFGIKVRVRDDEGLLRPGMAATVYVPRER